MRNIFQIIGPFLLVCLTICGCTTGTNSQPTQHVLDKPTIAHVASECPELTGFYTMTGQDGNVQEKAIQFKVDPSGAFYLIDDGYGFTTNGAIHKTPDGILDYIAGCSGGVVAIDWLAVDAKLIRREYQIIDKRLVIRNKALHPSVTPQTATEYVWTPK